MFNSISGHLGIRFWVDPWTVDHCDIMYDMLQEVGQVVYMKLEYKRC